ncbi:unnamed protein product [Lepidochelys kempii]
MSQPLASHPSPTSQPPALCTQPHVPSTSLTSQPHIPATSPTSQPPALCTQPHVPTRVTPVPIPGHIFQYTLPTHHSRSPTHCISQNKSPDTAFALPCPISPNIPNPYPHTPYPSPQAPNTVPPTP